MSFFEKMKDGAQKAQNAVKKAEEVRDIFSTKATEIDSKEAEQVIEKILMAGEKIEQSYRGLRDLLVFTDKRIIFVDIQGITGKRRNFISIPYNKIYHFAVETAGMLDTGTELKIYGPSGFLLCNFVFGKHAPIFEVQQKLAEVVL